MKYIFLALIRFYQYFIAYPLQALSGFGTSCRFWPSCSEYAIGAIGKFGVRRGGWLALRRVLKCHPYTAGGYDAVPEIKPAPRTR